MGGGTPELTTPALKQLQAANENPQYQQKKKKRAAAPAIAVTDIPLDEGGESTWRDFLIYIMVYEAKAFEVSRRMSSTSGMFAALLRYLCLHSTFVSNQTRRWKSATCEFIQQRQLLARSRQSGSRTLRPLCARTPARTATEAMASESDNRLPR